MCLSGLCFYSKITGKKAVVLKCANIRQQKILNSQYTELYNITKYVFSFLCQQLPYFRGVIAEN